MWAYNSVGHSNTSTLSSNTLLNPDNPAAGTPVTLFNKIVWKWHKVGPEEHYKWNSTNDFASAVDLLHDTAYTENNLACNTAFTRFVWSYNECGHSEVTTLNASTAPCPVCGDPITIDHLVANGVAPVDKTVTYGTVTGVPGEPTKCWITKNLGATNQAASATDATETAAD